MLLLIEKNVAPMAFDILHHNFQSFASISCLLIRQEISSPWMLEPSLHLNVIAVESLFSILSAKRTEESPISVIYNVDILKAMNWVKEAWAHLKVSRLHNCWRVSGLLCVNNVTDATDFSEEVGNALQTVNEELHAMIQSVVSEHHRVSVQELLNNDDIEPCTEISDDTTLVGNILSEKLDETIETLTEEMKEEIRPVHKFPNIPRHLQIIVEATESTEVRCIGKESLLTVFRLRRSSMIAEKNQGYERDSDNVVCTTVVLLPL